MSTLAGMFFMRSGTPGQEIQPPGCPVVDAENNLNLSDDDNTSCSASEMGCDLTLNLSAKSSSEESSRRNKRKNFMPRNIMEYAGSDEDEENYRNHVGKRGNHPVGVGRRDYFSHGILPSPDADLGENGHEELEMDCGDEDEEEDYDEECERDNGPLDLSDVQNDSKRLWRKPEGENKLFTPTGLPGRKPGVSSGNGSVAMDLRLSARPDLYEDGRSSDVMISSSSSSSAQLTSNNSSALDFAESTMKELLGLYGIAENFRQAGKQAEISGIHRHLETPGQHAKMILPENMARLLAAMQESVTGGGNVSGYVGLGGPQGVVQQPTVSSPTPTKNHSMSQNNNNHHGGETNFSHGQKGKGSRGTSTGRGLTSFPVIREGLLGKGTGPVDYTRYVRRYGNAAECGYHQCRELNYREHFHCLDCGDGTRVFVKKEEMIRHFKWHKKRDESLQHGFMRYSPMDDCSDRFRNCSHNRKQTHYHCLQDGCEKVYISTSDVQMHANYHRKDSAIIQEGFQRFRAAEDCGAEHCTFRNQRTTHFHCRRTSCSYTFKNKADMEKHKSYHIKDEQLNRDGFKKFMKHEACNYSNCRFSRVCNHIHCIREGCHYVLHSSGQLYSHKRKHERRDSELAYRKFKLAQSVMRGSFGADFPALAGTESLLVGRSEEENSRSSLTDQGDLDSDEVIKKFTEPCKCDSAEDEHYHCRVENCLNTLFKTSEAANEHSRNHELEDRISSLAFFTVDPANFDAQDSTIPCVSAKCPYQTREKHYHCLWDGCTEVILSMEEPFKRLDHFKAHEYSQKLEFSDKGESLDGFFRRKRGRPPKNRMIEVSSGANEAIFTSFKLPKPILSSGNADDSIEQDLKDPIGFLSYPEGTACPDPTCAFSNSTSTFHYHCGHPRCHFSVSDVHKLSLHLRDFHTNIDILDGYEFYDRNSECREGQCEFNGNLDHFHCSRDGFGFVRASVMGSHDSEAHGSETRSNNSSDDDEKYSSSAQVVKAAGTFYPISTVKKEALNNNTINNNNPVDLSSPNGDIQNESKGVTDHSLSRILQLPAQDNGETQFGPDAACGRPFCKLKRKTHFHCHLCNQAFSELEKLRPHVLKHNNFPLVKNEPSDLSTDEDSKKGDSDSEQNDSYIIPKKEIGRKGSPMDHLRGSEPSSPSTSFPPAALSNFLGYPPSHSPYIFLQQSGLSSLYANMMFGGGGATPFPPGISPPTTPIIVPTAADLSLPSTPLSIPSVLVKGKRPPSASSSSPSSPPDPKKQRLQMRILKDEPVPDGYIRFRFNEDCAYVHCGYREHQTHFHCTREDCGYSFCDKTRFVQHTARHERLDTLMGGDFKQYRANIPCGRSNCAYVPNSGGTQGQNKASHFHCAKCDFVCTDTNKVVAHRRQHQKLDSIMAAGFEKFTPSQSCQVEGCIHAQKQTHYHCLKCSYAVLGLSQMSNHKYRHADC